MLKCYGEYDIFVGCGKEKRPSTDCQLAEIQNGTAFVSNGKIICLLPEV